MFPLGRTRRFAAFLLAVAVVLPGAVAAVGSAATPPPCERERDRCPVALACACCHVGPADRSTPTPPPSSAASLIGPGLLKAFVPGAVTAPAGAESMSSAALRLYSPPHGYQSADISILLSVFLI